MAIASVTITCACCGKEFEHRQKRYNRRDADEYEAWAARNITLCPECRKAQYKEQQNAERAKACEPYTLPALTGTERQIAWAEKLRAAWIAEVEDYITRYGKDDYERISAIRRAVSTLLAEHTDCRFWIDTRDESFISVSQSLRRDALKAIIAAQKEAAEAEPEQPAEEPAPEQTQPVEETETIDENKKPEDGQKGPAMKIDYDALDRNVTIIRNAGLKLPIDEDEYFDLLRHARGAGIIDEEIDDVDGSVFADAIRQCAEVIEHPERLLPEARFIDVLNGEGCSSPEQPLEAIELKHKALLGRYLAHYDSERAEIANALSMLYSMSERFPGFHSDGITLFGYKIRDLTALDYLCSRYIR